MLRTALGPAIARFLEDASVVEVMLNPDGCIWIDRLSEGLSDTGERLSPADGERIVRLVRPLARFGALLAATAGVLSAISAINAPLIGNAARISVPLFAFAIAAILVSAGLERRVQIGAAVLFAVALAVLEYDLTLDAMWLRN